MDSTTRTSGDQPFEVLSDDELATVIGGADLKNFDAQAYAYEKIGMCGCAVEH